MRDESDDEDEITDAEAAEGTRKLFMALFGDEAMDVGLRLLEESGISEEELEQHRRTVARVKRRRSAH